MIPARTANPARGTECGEGGNIEPRLFGGLASKVRYMRGFGKPEPVRVRSDASEHRLANASEHRFEP